MSIERPVRGRAPGHASSAACLKREGSGGDSSRTEGDSCDTPTDCTLPPIAALWGPSDVHGDSIRGPKLQDPQGMAETGGKLWSSGQTRRRAWGDDTPCNTGEGCTPLVPGGSAVAGRATRAQQAGPPRAGPGGGGIRNRRKI